MMSDKESDERKELDGLNQAAQVMGMDDAAEALQFLSEDNWYGDDDQRSKRERIRAIVLSVCAGRRSSYARTAKLLAILAHHKLREIDHDEAGKEVNDMIRQEADNRQPLTWPALVRIDQRLSALELAATLTAPPYDSSDYWQVWTRITRQLNEITDDHDWPWHVRDVAYGHLLRTFESAADARGSVVK